MFFPKIHKKHPAGELRKKSRKSSKTSFFSDFRGPGPFQKDAGHPGLLACRFSAPGAAWVPSYDHFSDPEKIFEQYFLTSIFRCFFFINEVFKHFPACWGAPPPRPPEDSHQKFDVSMKKSTFSHFWEIFHPFSPLNAHNYPFLASFGPGNPSIS